MLVNDQSTIFMVKIMVRQKVSHINGIIPLPLHTPYPCHRYALIIRCDVEGPEGPLLSHQFGRYLFVIEAANPCRFSDQSLTKGIALQASFPDRLSIGPVQLIACRHSLSQ
ncbi:hypothetical protein D3C86_1917560 [compost metagenome]